MVSLNPLELELPDRPSPISRNANRSGAKKNQRDHRKKSSKLQTEYDDDDYDDLDDYTIERQLRNKSERDRFRKSSDRSGAK